MSSPSGIVTRVMMISLKRFVSSVCVRPAASVSSVLPVPAGPRIVTKSMSGSSSRFSAKFCSRLRAVMPQTRVALAAVVARQLERRDLAVDLAHDRLDAVGRSRRRGTGSGAIRATSGPRTR